MFQSNICVLRSKQPTRFTKGAADSNIRIGTLSGHDQNTPRRSKIQKLNAMRQHIRIREQERGYLAKNGIDPDTPYTSVTCVKIDGMSFYRWRLLHDDNFHPKSKSLLISAIHRLREDGYEEDAELIEDKYLNFLHPDFMELHTLVLMLTRS